MKVLTIFRVKLHSVKHLVRRSLSSCSTNKLTAPWKILFFGTDRFALECLKYLCSKMRTGTLISRLGVVSKSGSTVQKFSSNEKLPLHSWPVNADDIKTEYDLGVVVSFGKMIPARVIDAFPLGVINVHASILPRWRGPAPIYHAIMNGDAETGATVLRIHPSKFDVGEIVKQYRIPLSTHETASDVEKKLSVVGAELLMECIRDLPRCIYTAVPQPNEGVTHAPKIYSGMAKVRWNTMTCQQLYNLHRALSHLYPLVTSWHGRPVKLLDLSSNQALKTSSNNASSDVQSSSKRALAFLNEFPESKPSASSPQESVDDSKSGRIKLIKPEKCLHVDCINGVLMINKLKISGKTMTASDFYNGYMSKRPKSDWYFSDIVGE